MWTNFLLLFLFFPLLSAYYTDSVIWRALSVLQKITRTARNYITFRVFCSLIRSDYINSCIMPGRRMNWCNDSINNGSVNPWHSRVEWSWTSRMLDFLMENSISSIRFTCKNKSKYTDWHKPFIYVHPDHTTIDQWSSQDVWWQSVSVWYAHNIKYSSWPIELEDGFSN